MTRWTIRLSDVDSSDALFASEGADLTITTTAERHIQLNVALRGVR